jgi:Secretion system C-terminal sorting domain
LTPESVTGVNDNPVAIHSFELSQNYPNPFNPTTQIEYSVPQAGFVTLKVYNTLGQEVASLVNGMIKAGTHEVTFNGSNLTSGVYYYRIESGSKVSVKKMMLLK